jgi:hypothetical protein
MLVLRHLLSRLQSTTTTQGQLLLTFMLEKTLTVFGLLGHYALELLQNRFVQLVLQHLLVTGGLSKAA